MRIKFDLNALSQVTGESLTSGIAFMNITKKNGFKTAYEDVSIFTIQADFSIHVYHKSTMSGESLPQADAPTISDLGIITFDVTSANILMLVGNVKSTLYKLYNLGVITFDVDGYTQLNVYKQNSENDKLSKTLTFVDIIQGQFNHMIALKNVNVDVYNYARDYNYVFIPSLNRYYYVDSVEIVSADISRLHLKEDVLVTWKTLIKNQSAFVTRYENASNSKIVDNRLPLADVLTTAYITPTPTPAQNSLVNVTLKTDLADTKYKILVSSISSDWGYKHDVNAPSGIGLPSFTSLQSKNERNAFISFDQLSYLIDACIEDDTITTFINSVVLLPFDPETPYTNASQDGFINYFVQAKDKYLCDDGKFHTANGIPSGVNIVSCKGTTADATPYFIIADFTLSAPTNSFLDYEPYTNWEIYVAFVGWIKINASQCLGCRLIVYYTLDYKTGMGTAYIYNVTTKKLMWSSNCQFGIKLDLTTTNSLEITRQKQANELNMILGLMASAVSIGVGVASENPVAIVGGVLSAGKTIASAVNSNNMLFERAQTSFGTSEGVFHSPLDVTIRKTYHEQIVYQTNPTYLHLQGKPYNNYTSLSGLSGYVEVGEIHFDPMNADIYQDEITEIVELLQNGVIF